MGREIRCQAVIMKENKILVARQYNYQRQQEYWLLPGGGMDEGETPEACIRREMREEANIETEVTGILFDGPGTGADVYKRYITFLCHPLSEPATGSETTSHRRILELVWCPLEDESKWNEYLMSPQFYPSMKDIRKKVMVSNEGGMK